LTRSEAAPFIVSSRPGATRDAVGRRGCMGRNAKGSVRLLIATLGALILAGRMAVAGTRLALLITPSMPSTGTHSDFSELALVPFHDAQAVHTFSDQAKKYVFIYCKEPGKVKTIAVTLSYGSRPPDKNFS